MNDFKLSQSSSVAPSANGNSSEEEIPRFGAIDIVEAFTAMRHEWRGQTNESRDLGEQIKAAVSTLQNLESKLLATVAANRPDDTSETKRFVMLIIETDHQLSRAVTAIEQGEENRRQREASKHQAVEECIASLNTLARWFARPLLTLLAGQQSAQVAAQGSPALEGLNMVLARLRRMMREQNLERLDVLGQPFDADTMHAIGTVASTDQPPGHVAEQLAPAYRWKGQLIRFADVRVATESAKG